MESFEAKIYVPKQRSRTRPALLSAPDAFQQVAEIRLPEPALI
jgi:hypothetical protein